VSDTATPEPAVGQVWADSDPNRAGRTFQIIQIGGTAKGDDYATARVLTNSDSYQEGVDLEGLSALDQRGDLISVSLRRCRGVRGSHGYRYLRTEQV
jgi:hypothetical protein